MREAADLARPLWHNGGRIYTRHSGARLLARARNPYAGTAVIVKTGRRLSLNQQPSVVMDSGLAAARRPGMTANQIKKARLRGPSECSFAFRQRRFPQKRWMRLQASS